MLWHSGLIHSWSASNSYVIIYVIIIPPPPPVEPKNLLYCISWPLSDGKLTAQPSQNAALFSKWTCLLSHKIQQHVHVSLAVHAWGSCIFQDVCDDKESSLSHKYPWTVLFYIIWNGMRPREPAQNQQTRDLIGAWKKSHKQQRPELPMVPLTWQGVNTMYINSTSDTSYLLLLLCLCDFFLINLLFVDFVLLQVYCWCTFLYRESIQKSTAWHNQACKLKHNQADKRN